MKMYYSLSDFSLYDNYTTSSVLSSNTSLNSLNHSLSHLNPSSSLSNASSSYYLNASNSPTLNPPSSSNLNLSSTCYSTYSISHLSSSPSASSRDLSPLGVCSHSFSYPMPEISSSDYVISSNFVTISKSVVDLSPTIKFDTSNYSENNVTSSVLVNANSLPTAHNRKVVLDTGALIRLQHVEDMEAELIVPEGVLKEVKDPHARRRLWTLASLYLRVKEPLSEDISFVRNFAKVTGDLPFLSETDLDVIALTYMFHRNSPDCSTLRKHPPMIALKKDNNKGRQEQSITSNIITSLSDTQEHIQSLVSSQIPCTLNEEVGTHITKEFECSHTDLNMSDDESDEGWISADNYFKSTKSPLPMVACMTADFSIQNVMLQMGLNVISINCLQINTLRLWGLLCRGCGHFMRDTSYQFCAKCGQRSVDRIPITVNKNSDYVILHDNRKKVNLRGTIYSIPKPKGGRSDRPIILSEDMLFMNGRDREYRHQCNLWKKESDIRNPFNLDNLVYDDNWCKRLVTSTGKMAIASAPKIEIGLGKGNPNSNRWQKRHRRKK